MPWPGFLSLAVTVELSHFQKLLELCQSFPAADRVPAQPAGGSVLPRDMLVTFVFALVSEEHEGVQGTERGRDAVTFGNGMDTHGSVTYVLNSLCPNEVFLYLYFL